ncbi:hypothetical protein NNL21_21110 [Paenibacillus mendelii]|nr:hypothetical protein [Paenibacillus mendelii]
MRRATAGSSALRRSVSWPARCKLASYNEEEGHLLRMSFFYDGFSQDTFERNDLSGSVGEHGHVFARGLSPKRS